ncbi:MobF family relaxase [Metallibacterium scheffleri]
MITIDKIKNAATAARYYSALDDYYREGGQAPAEIAGRGAAFLGIAGAVTGEHDAAARLRVFGEVLAGRVAGRQVGDAETRVHGWDVSIQAPKSFSIAAAHDQRLRDVHDAAERRVFEHLETHGIVTRQRAAGGGYEWHAADVVALLARHTTNRNRDEHWHTHLVLASAVRDRQTGVWRSLDARELYAIRAELEGIYQSALAHGARATGFTLDWTVDSHGNPAFELREVPESLREAASSRKAEIDQALAERGVSREEATVSQRQAANRTTRSEKDPGVDRAALHAGWRERAIAHGYDPDARRGRLVGEHERHAAADDSVRRAIDHLSERDARFSARDLAHEARIYAQGHASDADLAAAIDRAQRSGALIRRGSWGRLAGGQRGHRDGYTTKGGVEIERALLGTAGKLERANGARLIDPTGKAPLSERGAQRAIERAVSAREAANGRPMTAEQRAVTSAILSSDSRLHVLSGHAGTAKTTSVLATVADQARASGIRVRAMAPTSSAAGTLGEALGAQSTTVAAVLHEQQKPARTGGRELWIVDEAGMVSARDMKELLARAERANATVILSGDSRQIGSVGAGAAYSQLSTSVQPEHRHQLTQIVRQSNEQLREAVIDAVHGRVRDALRKADTQEIKSRDAQIEAAASSYQAALATGQSALVVTLSRADRADVNKQVHAQRVASGDVRDVRAVRILDSKQWTVAQKSDAARYQTGDVIVWGAAHRRGPDRGEQTTVVESRDGLVTVQREDGSRWTFNPRNMSRFDVFDARALEVGRGDSIVTRSAIHNADGERLANGTRLEVMGVHSDHLTVRDDKGQHFDIDTQRGLHVDLGYAMTADQAQGRTVDVAIGVMRSGQENLADQSRLYVAISRARANGVVITDNQQKLAERLQINTGERQTALERGRAPQRALEPSSDRDPPLPGALAEWLAERERERDEAGQTSLPPMTTEPTDPEVAEAVERGRQQLGLDDPDPDRDLDDQGLDYDGAEIG